jgi:hypothetical protein
MNIAGQNFHHLQFLFVPIADDFLPVCCNSVSVMLIESPKLGLHFTANRLKIFVI